MKLWDELDLQLFTDFGHCKLEPCPHTIPEPAAMCFKELVLHFISFHVPMLVASEPPDNINGCIRIDDAETTQYIEKNLTHIRCQLIGDHSPIDDLRMLSNFFLWLFYISFR
jgi:hypothetical protein